MNKDKTVQITITIGEHDYNDLIDWAYSHGRTPAEYAAQIIAARIEANLENIKKLRERNDTPV